MQILNSVVAVFLLIVSTVFPADYTVTWDSRFQDEPPPIPKQSADSFGVLDVGVLFTGYAPRYRTSPAPSLYSEYSDHFVAITGNVQQAVRDIKRVQKTRLSKSERQAQRIWNRGVRALFAAEGNPLWTNAVPAVTPSEFVNRMADLTNAPSASRANDMNAALHAATWLFEQPARQRALYEDNDQ